MQALDASNMTHIRFKQHLYIEDCACTQSHSRFTPLPEYVPLCAEEPREYRHIDYEASATMDHNNILFLAMDDMPIYVNRETIADLYASFFIKK